MIGKTIAHFEVLEKIGQGGMGVVYRARDSKLKREVALKMVPPELTSQKERQQRFLVEAQAAAALNHTNIATVYAIEAVDDCLFMVMEYIQGQTLDDLLHADGEARALPIAEAVHYALQIADGLRAAHEKGVIHRDIKPANIMVTLKGQVKIMDFGIAKLSDVHVTQAGAVLGTAAYMSPEQARGEQVDHRSDIWSVGVVLYRMLAGQLPFQSENAPTLAYGIVHTEPPSLRRFNPDLPSELAAVVEKAMEKDPARRYQTMGELIADLGGEPRGGSSTGSRRGAPSLSERRGPTPVALSSGLPPRPMGSGLSGIQPAEREPTRPAIVVLPMVDRSPKKDQEFFCDGLTEELIDALAKIEGWRVVSRTSAFAFKDKLEDIRAIGERLNVTHALEGSVRTAGNRLRITARLIDVVDGFQLWSEKYDRELDDVFAIQENIARMVVTKMKIQPSLTSVTISVPDSENVEAYQLYLKARFHWNQRTEESLQSAVDYCRRAIAMSPDFARAYACLADSLVLLSFHGVLTPKKALPKAKVAAEKALELDERLAEAYTSLGCIRAIYDWDWSGSEEAFRRALAINPGSSTAHHWYAIWCLFPRGEFDRALAELKKAEELDPLSLVIKSGIAWQKYLTRRYESAIAELENAVAIDASFIMAHHLLSQSYMELGRYEEAIRAAEKAVSLSSGRALSSRILGQAYAAAGRADDARRVLASLLEPDRRHGTAYDLALIEAGLGREPEALDHLEKALDERNGWLIFVNVEPKFDRLRQNPRLAKIIKEIGLGS